MSKQLSYIMSLEYLSGSQKRKRKQWEDVLIQSQAKDINKYFGTNKRVKRE